MKQKTITLWLKAVAVAIGVLGLAFFGGATVYAFYFRPDYNTPLSDYLRENIVFLWITAFICYIILFFFWRIINEIGNDNSFSIENVKNFKCMGICGSLLIFENIIRIIVWIIQDKIHFFTPSLHFIALSYTLLKLIVFVIFIVLCYAMSKLVQNAYEIKQENELTI